MVQYKSKISKRSKEYLHNSYCMLDVEDLAPYRELAIKLKAAMEAKKFYFKKAEKRGRLIELYYRMQRGLPSYDHWRVPELRKRFRARNLTIFTEKAYKTDLIEALEASDEDMRFERFMDLPVELRARVYIMYYEDLPSLPTAPRHPPISLVSSQIRQESLPLFYSTCVFKIEINAHFQRRSLGYSKDFRSHTPPENVSRIKKVNLHTYGGVGLNSTWYIDATLERRRKVLSPVILTHNPTPAHSFGHEIAKSLNKAFDDQPETLLESVIASVLEVLNHK